MTPGPRQAGRAAATRSRLLAAGRELFAARGFAATGTEEIVARSGVTRGALYHHFRDKRDLFRAVFAEVSQEVHQQVNAAAMAGGEPWEGLNAACSAYLDATADPAVQRIVLLDGPSVLGWEEWRDIGSQDLFGLLTMGLHWAMASGQVEYQPVAPLVHVLLGALNEGALYMARAGGGAAARDEVTAVVTRLLGGIATG